MKDPPIPVLEIGGTHVTAALVDPQRWRVVPGSRRRDVLDPTASAQRLLSTLVTAADRIAPDAGRAWAVAVPAPFDYHAGVAWFEGVGKFEALHGLDVRRRLTELMAVRPNRINFVNDADAFVLGEWVSGSLRGRRRGVGITLGSGIGSGFVVDGRIVLAGDGVPPDGSVHRLSIDGRPLEETVSRRAIRRAFAEQGGDPRADVAEIAALAAAAPDIPASADIPAAADIAAAADGAASAAAEHDAGQTARAVLQTAFTALGTAVGPYLARFGAEALVIGGTMAGSWPLLEPFFTAGAQAGGLVVPTIVSRDGEAAALIGAAYSARNPSLRASA